MVGIRTCRWAVGVVLLVLGLVGAIPTMAVPLPGPDEFGYSGVEIPFNLRGDVGGTGTVLGLSDDQVSAGITLPFAFNFYGIDYDEVFVSSNGFVTFTQTSNSGCCSGRPVPDDDGINNIIAGFWEDLYPPGGGTIVYQTLGPAGSQEFVIGFYGVPHFSSGNQVTFEMILHEGSNAIELQYDSAPSDGGTHSIGIENADGTVGLQVAYGSLIEPPFEGNRGFLIGQAQFSEFDIQRLEIDFQDETDNDEFEIKGSFALGDTSDGIDLDNDDTTISFGTVSITIPAGSFYWNHGGYEFRDELGGANVWMTLHERQSNTFRFSIKADGVDLDGTENPTEVRLGFGIDFGSTFVRSNGELKFQSDEGRRFKKRKHHYKKKKHYYGGHKDREESYQHWSGSGHR